MLNHCTNFNFIPLVRFTSRKEATIAEKKKMGRPTNNPRPHNLGVRINDADKKRLEEYCKVQNINRTEAISRAINRLDV